MTIEQKFEILKEWVSTQMPINLSLKHDTTAIRDKSPDSIANRHLNPRHALTFNVPLPGLNINHGWGELKGFDKQIGNLEFRYFHNPPQCTFDRFLMIKSNMQTEK